MNQIFSKLIFIFATLLWVAIVLADDASFVAQRVVVQGNQRISAGTILSEIPFHVGQSYTQADGDAIIAALFKTGFFNNVSLNQAGSTLVVSVQERPTIGYLSITGNKEIKTKLLYGVLKNVNLVEGDVYDPAKLKEIQLSLENEYATLGHETAIVNIYTHPLPHNQVSLAIQITEGPIAKIHSITFSGNAHFSQRQLRDTFTMTTPGLMTIFNHHDRYSDSQLSDDLISLQNFYYDHGYLRFKVLSKDVTFNTTHTKADIHVVISEGPVYRISGFRLNESDSYAAHVLPLITLKPGDVFSRTHVISVVQSIAHFLGDHGYAFPNIQPMPILNDQNRTVFIVFQINIGSLIYIHDVDITGNTRTDQRVIRIQMRQMEDAVYSQSDIDESKRRIQSNLPYLTDVKVSAVPVPNQPDQVDLDYDVKEVNAGRATLNGGYSDVEGFIYGANYSEPSFMGTGKAVSLGFTRSEMATAYNFSYTNPFYTIDGISRTFNLSYTISTPGNVGLESYSSTDLGGNFSYGIPISEFDSVNIGAGFDYVTISDVDTSTVSPSVTQFLARNPSPYNEPTVIGGLTHQSLDRAIFPTTGNLQQISLTAAPPLGNTVLGYYTGTYNAQWYVPFGQSGFVAEAHTILGYGNGIGSDGSLPFFYNFYGGGLGTLPGFSPNSLGPKNPNDTDESMGGNVETFAGINLFAPTILSDRVRVGATVDAGNIFDTHQITSTPSIQYENVALSNMRMSAGVLVSWWWPLGAPINFSLAFPLNKKANDQESVFGFSMGGSI